MAWRLLAFVLTAAVGVLPMAPPEHVHDVDHDGHHETLAHRHAGGHAQHAAGVIDHDDHDRDHDAGHAPVAALDDEDSVLAALSTPTWTRPALDAPDAPATAVVAWILPPAPATRVGHVADVERLIHGPPRTVTSLRGPPVVSRL
jgi:hypothetical protein